MQTGVFLMNRLAALIQRIKKTLNGDIGNPWVPRDQTLNRFSVDIGITEPSEQRLRVEGSIRKNSIRVPLAVPV